MSNAENKNNYQGKAFSILGDSISTFSGYSEPSEASYYTMEKKLSSGVLTFSDTWWGKVIDVLGGTLLKNNSISGSTVCNHPSYRVPSYGCSKERTSSLNGGETQPDVIMVFMGINDWAAGVRIANSQALQVLQDGEQDPTFFLPAYKRMLQRLKANYPEAEIWCMTLPISDYTKKGHFEFPYYYGGRHISTYSEAIREAAREYGCKLIDLEKSNRRYDTMDEFHPNASGMDTIATAVLSVIQTQEYKNQEIENESE